jgi:hypothetical protein
MLSTVATHEPPLFNLHADIENTTLEKLESVFKNFVTREGLGVRFGYGTPKTLSN